MESTLSVSKRTGVGRFRIEGFSLLKQERGDYVFSEPVVDIFDTKWEIIVYPRGGQGTSFGWICVQVCYVSGGPPKIHAAYSVSLTTSAGEVKHREQSEHPFNIGNCWKWDNFFCRSKLDEFVDDVVIFELSVTLFVQETAYMPTVGPSGSSHNPCADVVADLKSLWDSGEHSDVVLHMGEEELRVHKAMLVARSPVFARMLATSDMKEAATGVIRIEDVESSTMQLLCEFIYTGSIRDPSVWEDAEAAAALLQAAAKYEVHGCVRLCAAKAVARLSVHSAPEWLTLAMQIGPQAEDLRARCVQFIVRHLSQVQSVEGWRRLIQNTRVFSEVAPMLFQTISPPAKPDAVGSALAAVRERKHVGGFGDSVKTYTVRSQRAESLEEFEARAKFEARIQPGAALHESDPRAESSEMTRFPEDAGLEFGSSDEDALEEEAQARGVMLPAGRQAAAPG